MKRYAQTHRELTREIKSRWRKANPEKQAASAERWRQGGAHILSNLRPACMSCNSRKGHRWPLTV